MLQHTTKTLARASLPRSRAHFATRQLRTTSRQNDKDTAFDPRTTKPEEQKERAAEELTHEQPNSAATSETNPANPEANKARDPQEGGPQGSRSEHNGQPENPAQASRSGASGGGSPPKAGGGKSGGGGGT